MTASFQIEHPDNITCSMQVTMTLGEWKKVKETLGISEYPHWKLAGAIRSLVQQAETRFTEKGTSE